MPDIDIASGRPDSSRTLLLRDIVDGQLRTREGRRIGRVADVSLEWTPRGLYLRELIVGPEADLGRVWWRLGEWSMRLFRGRYEHAIGAEEIEEIGPNVMLRNTADKYNVGHADDWIRRHIFRFIPGGNK